jgi:hypothetical protein
VVARDVTSTEGTDDLTADFIVMHPRVFFQLWLFTCLTPNAPSLLLVAGVECLQVISVLFAVALATHAGELRFIA